MYEVPEPPPAATGPVDPAVVEELRAELDDQELLLEIISTFLDDSVRRLDSIVQAATRPDPTVLRAQAHALKGSAGTFGARQLSELCHELEYANQEPPSKHTSDLVNSIVVEHQRVHQTLLLMLRTGAN
jgi:HPt (histidine-containing phosphotransfer) domain-containing protein